MDRNKAGGGGIGVCSVLGIVFIVLKLCNVINWSWWWVLAPYWIPIGLVVVLCAVIGICKVISNMIDKSNK